jgi:hypothetical protein
MVLPSTFSRRKRQAKASVPDVYNYDEIPNRVRVQVVQLIESGLGFDTANPTYRNIVIVMRRELGVHELIAIPLLRDRNFQNEFLNWRQIEENIDYWLDGVEISLRMIDSICSY